jgi:DNA modification methylase
VSATAPDLSPTLLTGRSRMRVADLRPSDRNPRTITTSRFENLKRSLQEDRAFLDARPLLVNSYPGREHIVIGGNMRLRAAQDLGWAEVPVLVVSVPPEVEAQWNLKDNNQWGEYDDSDLAEILHGLEAQGADVGLLGFTSDEVERLLALVGISADADDEGFDPTPPVVPTSQPGDVYLLGPHRLVCGDARDAATWDALVAALGTDTADAMWTDPPYGVDLQVDGQSAIRGDQPSEFGPLLDAVLVNADRWLRPGGPVYMTGPSGRLGAEFVRAWERVGWHLAQSLVWVKNAFVPGRSDYHHQHEAIYYGWKTGASHAWIGGLDKASIIDDEPDVSRMRREDLLALVKQLRNARSTDVIREDKTRHNDLHPTMKPTALIRHLLANSTRRGDVVLDPFAGSGSTLVACELLGRRAAMIELEAKFCDVIVRRWLELDPSHQAQRCRNGRTESIDG